ncbi:MAG: hypothetical protein PSV40_20005 [Polaromonas sp.]|nr:hypothetical protein [Polaromonas sp.]MDI1271378.1 hypothetical protein [Polaromonas sp.]
MSAILTADPGHWMMKPGLRFAKTQKREGYSQPMRNCVLRVQARTGY